MFRKLTLALAASAALGAAALTPTAASAGGGWHGYKHHSGHHGWNRGIGIGFYGPTYAAGGDCHYVRKVVYTSYGKRFRRVLVCD